MRELENNIERAVTLSKNNKITLADLPPHLITNNTLQSSYSGTSLTELKHKAIEEIESIINKLIVK